MNGYMIHHEVAINHQAAAVKSLANEYQKIIDDARTLTQMKGWDSPAAKTQKDAIQKVLNDATVAKQELERIGDDLYTFTATHKTWLEDLVDTVTGGGEG